MHIGSQSDEISVFPLLKWTKRNLQVYFFFLHHHEVETHFRLQHTGEEDAMTDFFLLNYGFFMTVRISYGRAKKKIGNCSHNYVINHVIKALCWTFFVQYIRLIIYIIDEFVIKQDKGRQIMMIYRVHRSYVTVYFVDDWLLFIRQLLQALPWPLP